MSFAGGRRVFLYFFMVALLVFPALQIWVCPNCRAGAARVFPGFHDDATSAKKKKRGGRDHEELFDKYYFFNGRTRRDPNLNETDQKGFEDSKRRVPSCPDPLHN
ncbi:CLAVATA3/ESR (CLE)-related protein [Trema orientale]|uniref:CLAVATA3/ESR (CLE)-related protein n=1 Tax=Trema orientale TaxID=63057 RepID=A0A2P5FDR8_TREOI|nr:CLAVATA3/ESR (CLE)-related protein [Trema orientale]